MARAGIRQRIPGRPEFIMLPLSAPSPEPYLFPAKGLFAFLVCDLLYRAFTGSACDSNLVPTAFRYCRISRCCGQFFSQLPHQSLTGLFYPQPACASFRNPAFDYLSFYTSFISAVITVFSGQQTYVTLIIRHP